MKSKTKLPFLMPSNCVNAAALRGSERGFTLAETLVAVAVLAFMVVSLYAGFTSGFGVLRIARENLRATQILEQHMEVLRLIKWDDLRTPGFVPQTFTAPFYATDPTNAASGLIYYGKVTLTNAPVSETYASHLQMIQIDLTWTSGTATRRRTMTTFVSENGMQPYIY